MKVPDLLAAFESHGVVIGLREDRGISVNGLQTRNRLWAEIIHAHADEIGDYLHAARERSASDACAIVDEILRGEPRPMGEPALCALCRVHITFQGWLVDAMRFAHKVERKLAECVQKSAQSRIRTGQKPPESADG